MGSKKKVVTKEKEVPKTISTSNNKELVNSINTLVKRVDTLISLFEEASKHVTEVETTEVKIKELTTKLETLLEQNKNVARGLILLEKYVRGKTELTPESAPKPLSEFGGM